MPEPARPNPSLFVLDIPRAADRARIAERLIRDAPGEDGSPLAPLGGNRYVVSRAVAKKLARAHPALLDWLGRLDGVALARRMRADQGVALYGALDPADPTHRARGARNRAPASPWHYKEIRLAAALRHLQRQNPGGLARVRVAQIDTGFTEHPCFGSWRGGQNPHIRADLGLNFLESGEPPRDPFEDQYPGFPGHGSRIASIIAANNPGLMQGAAPGVSLVPYRVTNTVVINFFGNVTRLGEAIDHAWRHNGCQVINISMGDPCAPGEEHGAAVDAAYEAGVIIVAAAGNVTSEVTYPGRHARTITCGGVGPSRQPWSGGARGPRVDVCGPADKIWRASWAKDKPKANATNAKKKTNKPTRKPAWTPVYAGNGDGTSYATAHISGLACLWTALHQRDLAAYPHRWQIVEAFRQTLGDSSRQPDDWDERLFGRGIVDAERLLKAPLPAPDTLRYEEDRAADDLA